MDSLAERGVTQVLLVEDNPMDVYLVQMALEEERTWRTETTIAEDGEKAIDYLLRQGDFADAVVPDLVILDLNLPKRDGTEVLQLMRNTQTLSALPIIVLSSSPEDVIQDKVRRSRAQPDCSFRKPLGAEEVLKLGEKLRICYERTLKSQADS